MIVKAAPLFATILCRWFGRLAMPIGDAESAAAGGAILGLDLKMKEGRADPTRTDDVNECV